MSVSARRKTISVVILAIAASALAWAMHYLIASKAYLIAVPATVPEAPTPPLEIPPSQLVVPKGLLVEKFADGLFNPVSLCIDDAGRVLVTESHRIGHGVEESAVGHGEAPLRGHEFFTPEELSLATVDDRRRLYEKYADRFTGGMKWFTENADQVQVLVDSDGDGRAEAPTTLTEGFHEVLDGTAAGIISKDDKTYVACAPNLWLIDAQGNRKSLLYGFGVNISAMGHDLHGLTWGPDGKLYFSVGDRGFCVTSQEGKTFSGPCAGAVFRCEPDGSEFEVVATGLRNPEELAFDQFGNLFTADNNADAGDDSRLVYVMEGGDCGWNLAYQSIFTDEYWFGPWIAENLWRLPFPGQAAAILPPVALLPYLCPAGFSHYPGIGLPDRYSDHFFLCDFFFAGTINSFSVLPNGAGFSLADCHTFMTPVLATDVDFGYDGKMYLSDWVQADYAQGGSGGVGKGRIYTVCDPAQLENPRIVELTEMFRGGFQRYSIERLIELLDHPDMRVRLRSQQALAARGESVVDALCNLAMNSQSQHARLHAIWGMGRIARRNPACIEPLFELLQDKDPEIRGNLAKVLGDARCRAAASRLISLLVDENLRVQSFAAMALGKIGDPAAIEPIFAMIQKNNDQDPYLRHAGVMGLFWIGDASAVVAHAQDIADPVRMATLLVLRRMKDARIGAFLNDINPLIVVEAARAINDLPIPEAMSSLAALARSPDTLPEPLLRRVINANFRCGGSQNAKALIGLAIDQRLGESMRSEALEALIAWKRPGPLDRVTGAWRPLEHAANSLDAVTVPFFEQLIASSDAKLHGALLELAGQTESEAHLRILADLAKDKSQPILDRLYALRILGARGYPQLNAAVEACLADQAVELRAEALDVLATYQPREALAKISQRLSQSTFTRYETQQAVQTLARIKGAEASDLLKDLMHRLVTFQLPADLELEVTEAVFERQSDVLSALEEYDRHRRKTETPGKGMIVRQHHRALFGGDPARGRELFRTQSAGQCMRCHRIDGNGGIAGPDLSHVGKDHTREYLLESIVDPNAKIAQGFEFVTFLLDSGKTLSGVIQSESDNGLTVRTTDGSTVEIAKAEIESRSESHSPMPVLVGVLSDREIRDLVAYLAELR